MSANKQLTKPCRECPWRRASAPGYLGASNPLEFLELSESEAKMPCHLTVNYESADWKSQADDAPHCAGRAIHFANRCKEPKAGIPKLPANRDDVFTWPQEFIDHHTAGTGPKVMIAGNRVLVME